MMQPPWRCSGSATGPSVRAAASCVDGRRRAYACCCGHTAFSFFSLMVWTWVTTRKTTAVSPCLLLMALLQPGVSPAGRMLISLELVLASDQGELIEMIGRKERLR